MNRPTLVIAIAVLTSVPLAGCVSQEKYDTVSETATSLDDRVAMLNQENASLKATVERQQRRMSEVEAQNRELLAESALMAGSVRELENYVGQVDQRLTGMRFGLTPQVDRALRKLADSNSKLISYDPSMGMVRFASDLTFNSGSDVVKPEAMGVLKQFASVLSSVDADGYDLRVVGHTDNQPMSNPATVKAHRNNRYLSAHRAIAVSEALQGAGISAKRIEVAGWGSQRPLVPNNAKGGTAANRRVEIFLVPTLEYAGSAAVDGSPASAPAAGAATDDSGSRRRNLPIK